MYESEVFKCNWLKFETVISRRVNPMKIKADMNAKFVLNLLGML